MHSSSADKDLLMLLASSNLFPAMTRCILQYTNFYNNVLHRKEVLQYLVKKYNTGLTSVFDSHLIAQAFVARACDCICTRWHTPSTFEVCRLSNTLIALKRHVVVASSMGLYDKFNSCCLLCFLCLIPNLIRNGCDLLLNVL